MSIQGRIIGSAIKSKKGALFAIVSLSLHGPCNAVRGVGLVFVLLAGARAGKLKWTLCPPPQSCD